MIINKKNIINAVGASVLLLVVLGGFFATGYMTKKIEDDERSNLLLRAQMIAVLIDTNALSRLSGTTSDMITPEYGAIKSALERVHALNTDSRFVYISGLRDDNQFFYVDAENPSSPDFSPAGQIYPEATQIDKENFSQKIPYTKGPYTDSYGTWFTAYAPIMSADGVIREIGIDIDANKLLLRIAIVRQATIIIFSLIFLALLSVFVLVRKSVVDEG